MRSGPRTIGSLRWRRRSGSRHRTAAMRARPSLLSVELHQVRRQRRRRDEGHGRVLHPVFEGSAYSCPVPLVPRPAQVILRMCPRSGNNSQWPRPSSRSLGLSAPSPCVCSGCSAGWPRRILTSRSMCPNAATPPDALPLGVTGAPLLTQASAVRWRPAPSVFALRTGKTSPVTAPPTEI